MVLARLETCSLRVDKCAKFQMDGREASNVFCVIRVAVFATIHSLRENRRSWSLNAHEERCASSVDALVGIVDGTEK